MSSVSSELVHSSGTSIKMAHIFLLRQGDSVKRHDPWEYSCDWHDECTADVGMSLWKTIFKVGHNLLTDYGRN